MPTRSRSPRRRGPSRRPGRGNPWAALARVRSLRRPRFGFTRPKCSLCRRRIPGKSFKAKKPTCYWCKERLGLV